MSDYHRCSYDLVVGLVVGWASVPDRVPGMLPDTAAGCGIFMTNGAHAAQSVGSPSTNDIFSVQRYRREQFQAAT